MIPHQRLRSFTQEVFLKIGCDQKDAEQAASVLISSDLRGIDSHGVARLPGYVRLWRQGRIKSQALAQVVHETPSTAVVDGDQGLGLVVAPFAMKVAMHKATQVGSGWVSVKNSNHFGIAGYHAMMALDNDMIGFAMTNASPLVAPTFSAERLLGTNPIAVAIPALAEPAFVADLATTTVANGKMEILQRKEESAPLGWAQDANGKPSQDAFAVHQGGALLPLGGDRLHGSHKGYCLGAVVDILSAVLSGANYGPWVPPFVSFLAPPENPVGEGIGHFFGALRIDAFRPAQEFKEHMDQWIQRFRQSQPVNPEEPVMVPGDPEREAESRRTREGIPLIEPVIKDLNALAAELEIEF